MMASSYHSPEEENVDVWSEGGRDESPLGFPLRLPRLPAQSHDVVVLFGRGSRFAFGRLRFVQVRRAAFDQHHPVVVLEIVLLFLLERLALIVKPRVGDGRALASFGKKGVVEFFGVGSVDRVD